MVTPYLIQTLGIGTPYTLDNPGLFIPNPAHTHVKLTSIQVYLRTDTNCNYLFILVMEFCGGGDLSTVIKQRKCLSEQTCRRFVQQLASALQYLRCSKTHSKSTRVLHLYFRCRQNNVSHMDLKPSNLLVTSSNPPILKVADFGFAQHLEENSKDRGLKGVEIKKFSQN